MIGGSVTGLKSTSSVIVVLAAAAFSAHRSDGLLATMLACKQLVASSRRFRTQTDVVILAGAVTASQRFIGSAGGAQPLARWTDHRFVEHLEHHAGLPERPSRPRSEVDLVRILNGF
jgi:hypothetical protein